MAKEGYWKRFGKALVSWKGVVVLLATAAVWGYFLSSFDLIPDVVPLFGYVDDGLFLIGTAYTFYGLYNRFVKK